MLYEKSGENAKSSQAHRRSKKVRTKIIRSKPERKRSVWNLYAECSCSFGMLSASADLAMELMNFR